MKEAFEKILERLDEELRKSEERYYRYLDDGNLSCMFDRSDMEERRVDTIKEMLEIVQEVSKEYNDSWIPCSDDSSKLPKENEKVRVTVWTGIERIGFRQYGKWYTYTSEGIEEATVVAWQPTEPFKERY